MDKKASTARSMLFILSDLMIRLGKGGDIGLAVEGDVILAEIAGKGGDITEAERAVMVKIRMDHVCIRGEGLRGLGPIGEKGIIQPIIQRFGGVLAEKFEKCLQMTVLRFVFLIIRVGERLMEITVDGGIFEEDAIGGLDLRGRHECIIISKISQRCLGIVFSQLLQNAIHDEELLIGGGIFFTFGAMATDILLGIVHPEEIAVGGAIKSLRRFGGAFGDEIQPLFA